MSIKLTEQAAPICGHADEDSDIGKLRLARVGYESEFQWHRFLIDAYLGSGGFSGKLKLPASSWWGAAADMYASGASIFDESDDAAIDSYLDRFPREDIPKYNRRVAVAHYPNYIGPIIETKVSFISGAEFDYEVPEELSDWLSDVDGDGTTWQSFLHHTVWPRAAVLGYCPVLFDAPVAVEGQSAAQGSTRLRADALFPGNILDWHRQNGVLEWVKIRTTEATRDPLGVSIIEEVVTIWTGAKWARWWIREREGQAYISRSAEGTHDFGRVPVEFFRFKKQLQCSVRGVPLAWSESQEAKRLFNVISELDDHTRSTVFAIFAFPTDNPSQIGELTMGNNNALAIPATSSVLPQYIAPPSSVSSTLMEMAKSIISEMYRMSRLEFTRGEKGGGSAMSGISRAFEFQDTNRSVGMAAQALAESDARALKIVAAFHGLNPDTVRVTPPKKFDTQELISALEEAMGAVQMDLGPTFNTELKQRLAAKALPNMDEDLKQKMFDEIAQRELESEVRSAQAAQIGLFDTGDDNEDSADDGEGDGADGGDGVGTNAPPGDVQVGEAAE